MSEKIKLQQGGRYRVKIRGHSRSTVRIFKWNEKRFRSIQCHVFTAPVAMDVKSSYDPATKSLRLSGKKVPRSEVSVPHYDLVSCSPI